MTKIIKRIESLINERTDLNIAIQNILFESKKQTNNKTNPVNLDDLLVPDIAETVLLRDIISITKENEKKLNTITINNEIISILNKIKQSSIKPYIHNSEKDIERYLIISNIESIEKEVKKYVTLYDKQIEMAQNSKLLLREMDNYTDNSRALLNYQIVSLNDKRQLYIQACADIDSLVDYL